METEFFKSALVDAIVPEDTVNEVSELLQNAAETENESNRLIALKERDLLFFDERIRALAVLKLPACSEEVLNAYLSRLEFKIDVWAVDESRGEESNAPAQPAKDLVHSVEVSQDVEPIVLASESEDQSHSLMLVWEVEIVLNRPKFRVQQPSIILIPLAAIGSPRDKNSDHDGDLPPFQALEANILEPMRMIPGVDGNPPYLAASRLERVLPVTASHRSRIHIQHAPSRRYTAIPATMTRLRYQIVNDGSPTPSTVALLDLDIIPFVKIEATIADVHLGLRNGNVETLMPDFLPTDCRSGDCLTLLYRLSHSPDKSNVPGLALMAPVVDILSISVRLNIRVSENCQPVLAMEWTTHVDFTQALNPAFGAPAQPIQRPNRPTSLPVNNGTDSRPVSTVVTTSLLPSSTIPVMAGISISFSATNKAVSVGEAFTWQVLVVNNSPKSAKVAIIPLPRVPRQTTQAQSFAKRHAPKSSTASFRHTERRHTQHEDDVNIAQAIVDENVMFAMHHSNNVPPETDLMALTAELRIGPLAPGQCHESEIQMVAFQTGSLRVDAMRVVDLVREVEEGTAAAGVFADIRDLPEVVVVE